MARNNKPCILALDCATKTGWALYTYQAHTNNFHITTGVQDFTKRRGESNGMMFLRFRGWLNSLRNLREIDVVAYEQAHHRGGAATEICVNLTGRAQEFAAENNAETIAVHTATVKKFATGSGKASKEEMIAYFTSETGRKPEDDNEADAYALLKYVMQDLGVEL